MSRTGPYLARQRHLLLDAHIPDWDSRMLSKFDPGVYADLCASSGADAVMVYCVAHTGLSYYPASVGASHRSTAGRSFVGELVDLLHQSDIAVCGYYSAIFNNWAYTTHPDWRMVPSSPGGPHGDGSRFAQCCPSNPQYMEFMLRQVRDITSRYRFEAFFFDMLFWPHVCVCEHCRARYRADEQAEIPERIDWYSPAWIAFQRARERWLVDAFRELRNCVKSELDIPVFCNLAPAEFGWLAGISLELIELNDLAGGDFGHQGTFSALAQLTPSVLQYMAATTAYCGGAASGDSLSTVRTRAFTATAFGGQFMAIDAVEPDGSLIPAVYDTLRTVFEEMARYESFLGGRPVADVAVYFSPDANVDLADNGTSLGDLSLRLGFQGDHYRAVQGATRVLGEDHITYATITRKELANLDQYAVVVLPDVLRMDEAEVKAFEDYVAMGGRLYASGHTSLISTNGVERGDFALAGTFGCRYVKHETAAISFAKPATGDVAAWIAPRRYAANGEPWWATAAGRRPATALRITSSSAAEVLATLTLPYRDGRGTRDDQGWATIAGAPPWDDTEHPVVVRSTSGSGEAIYSALSLEGVDGPSSQGARDIFRELIKELLGDRRTFRSDAHPYVWTTVFDDPEEDRMRLCFLNHQTDQPPLPIPAVRFRVAPPEGRRFVGLVRLPARDPLSHTIHENGELEAVIHGLETFEMVAAEYQRA